MDCDPLVIWTRNQQYKKNEKGLMPQEQSCKPIKFKKNYKREHSQSLIYAKSCSFYNEMSAYL